MSQTKHNRGPNVERKVMGCARCAELAAGSAPRPRFASDVIRLRGGIRRRSLLSSLPVFEPAVRFDYANQSWLKADEAGTYRYRCCGHRDEHNCDCYGKKWEGFTPEQVETTKRAFAKSETYYAGREDRSSFAGTFMPTPEVC